MNVANGVRINHIVPGFSDLRIYTTLNFPSARTYFVGIYLAKDLKMVTYIQ